MHAPKRITRLTMIELRYCTDGPPAIRGVAVLTGKRQIAVGAMRTLHVLGSRASRESGNRKSQEESELRCYPSAHDLHPAFVL
jgi:hypothetical protein